MKTMKAICTATVLALTLSVSAFAGDISSPGALSAGEIGTPGAVGAAPSTLLTDYDSVGTFEDWVLTLMSIF